MSTPHAYTLINEKRVFAQSIRRRRRLFSFRSSDAFVSRSIARECYSNETLELARAEDKGWNARGQADRETGINRLQSSIDWGLSIIILFMTRVFT